MHLSFETIYKVPGYARILRFLDIPKQQYRYIDCSVVGIQSLRGLTQQVPNLIVSLNGAHTYARGLQTYSSL